MKITVDSKFKLDCRYGIKNPCTTLLLEISRPLNFFLNTPCCNVQSVSVNQLSSNFLRTCFVVKAVDLKFLIHFTIRFQIRTPPWRLRLNWFPKKHWACVTAIFKLFWKKKVSTPKARCSTLQITMFYGMA